MRWCRTNRRRCSLRPRSAARRKNPSAARTDRSAVAGQATRYRAGARLHARQHVVSGGRKTATPQRNKARIAGLVISAGRLNYLRPHFWSFAQDQATRHLAGARLGARCASIALTTNPHPSTQQGPQCGPCCLLLWRGVTRSMTLTPSIRLATPFLRLRSKLIPLIRNEN